MKTKEEIVNNWLPRYTGTKLEDFGKYILLTNFDALGEQSAAQRIEAAVMQTLSDQIFTRDLGGTATTSQMTDAVIVRLGN